MNLTEEQVLVLAWVEREMDAGRQPFVWCCGDRWAMSREVLDLLCVVSGQTVSGQMLEFMQFAEISRCKADSAIKAVKNGGMPCAPKA